MKTRYRTLVVGGVLAGLGLSVLGPMTSASASVQGRRNTAAALTAIAAYHAVKGHTGETVLAGGAALYAWKRVGDEKHHRHSRAYWRHQRWLRSQARWHHTNHGRHLAQGHYKHS